MLSFLQELTVPILSVFYGLIIYMFNEEGGQCHLPHIHVETTQGTAVVALNGKILKGGLPANKRRLLQVWMELHREELETNWLLVSKGEPHIKIEGLK